MELKCPLILDGGMGTMLQRNGLKPGAIPELLNITDPDRIRAVHRAYVQAGSRVVYSNTFGANRMKMEKTGYTVEEIVAAGVRIAKECAAETGAMAALDIGPLGVMLAPLGTLKFEDAYDMFAQIARAGAEAGADLAVIETMSDLYEAKAALLAVKENTGLPVFVTMSFDATGRTFTGCTPASMARTMEGLGADAVGVNCSLGPAEMAGIVKEIRMNTSLPVIAKPNAGLPDPVTGAYNVGPEEFGGLMVSLAEAGADILGGCCGTDPDFIRETVKTAGNRNPRKFRPARGAVCTPPVCKETGRVMVIGERINPTGKKRLQQALLEEDLDYLVELAVSQMDAGADILDVNVGYPGVDEVSLLPRAVQAIQAAVDLPLQLDSTNPKALEAALRIYNGKAAMNSVNGKEESLETVLPLVKKYGAAVVGLTLDEKGIPQTAEGRFEIAKRIMDRAVAVGIPKEDIWIDCLTLTVSAQQEQAMETLKAVRRVTEELGLNTVLGVSNISFGLPNRMLVTQAFLMSAFEAGLKLPIINPNQKEMMDMVAARRVLSGEDESCRAFVDRFAETAAEVKAAPAAAGKELTLQDAIRRGMKKEAARITADALKAGSGMEIVEQELIPALEKTGEAYEKGSVFLPQLLSAAQAAQAAFEQIKEAVLKKGGKTQDRGTLIMATVQGDIHDIGKNIVVTVLENYGWRVIDLGRDVPPEVIVRETVEKNIRLVGLSALMTTTLPAMEETVRQLKALDNPPRVMVGGAVVTADYAARIGADDYAKDVRDSVKIAMDAFGDKPAG